MSNFLGKTIALISNKDLRYVGVLDKISAEDATVSLKSVRSFGTEGRMAEKGQPHMEVMPGVEIYDYVVFRGSDVKDLVVMDEPVDEVRPIVYYPPQDVAAGPQGSPTAAYIAPVAPGSTNSPRNAGQNSQIGSKGNDYNRNGKYTTQESKANNTSALGAQDSPAHQHVASDQTGRHSGPTQFSQAPQNEPTVTETQKPTKTSNHQAPAQAQEGDIPVHAQEFSRDFDFEEANKRFEKERLQNTSRKPTYDKNTSFFDSISSNEHGGNMRWGEEKNMNMDAFGEAYAGRGRGGFRGGRGGRGQRGGRGNGYRGNRGRGSYGYRGRGSSEPKPEWA